MNVEIAAACGILHDIYYLISGSGDKHAIKGAECAEKLLQSMNLYSDDDIRTITTAISKHSDKQEINGEYDELLKDADVMDHCFYNNDFPIAEREAERYKNLLTEFQIHTKSFMKA